MALQPTRNNILVVQKEVEKTTAGGIILAGANIESGIKPAVVRAVGPDVTEVKVGSVIYLKWSESVAVTVDGEASAIVSEESVLGIVS